MTAVADDLRGRRVTVMGLGLFGGGVGAARWLAARGARVTATDQRDAATLAPALDALRGSGVEVRLGGHSERDFDGAEVVVVNPAVAPSSPWLARARAGGASVTSEVALFLERCPARTAAVTGTQGKSSTATFLARLAEGHARRVHLGGNIGGSLLELLDDAGAEDLVVLELSSYQLEALPPAGTLPRRTDVVVVTNVLADHLERHGDVASYARAKSRILELASAGGLAILPAELAGRAPFEEVPCGVRAVTFGRAPDGVRTATFGRAEDGAELAIAGGRFVAAGEDLGAVASLRVPGAFQRANVLVALAAARCLGVPAAELRERIAGLAGLPHRVEDLGIRAGVRVIDNGVSTTPDSTLAALEGLGDPDAPLTVLLGGAAKLDLAFDELARALAARGALAVLFGAATAALRAACEAHGVRHLTAAGACDAAAAGLAATPRGGTLLFSPACASFDAWPNFRARALAFRAALPVESPAAPADDLPVERRGPGLRS